MTLELKSFGASGKLLSVAYARKRGWDLHVQLRPFIGFHPYPLVRGYFNGTYISLDRLPGRAGDYASDFIPPDQIPSGGQIDFSDQGRIMGRGFYSMFNGDGSDAVGVAGGLKCHYPKREAPPLEMAGGAVALQLNELAEVRSTCTTS
ncbi:MAG: hypothetical protein ACR2QA_03625 [Solirubrobacteraceae bacterium]